MLLPYVDNLFVTREDKLIEYAKRRLATKFKMEYLGMMHYFLGMEVWKCRWEFPWLRKVCSGYSEEIQNVGLHGDIHTYGIKLEAFV